VKRIGHHGAYVYDSIALPVPGLFAALPSSRRLVLPGVPGSTFNSKTPLWSFIHCLLLDTIEPSGK
jgi:hypothetical protein